MEAAAAANARRERRKSRARRLSGIDASAVPRTSPRGAAAPASDEIRGAAMLAEWNRAAGVGETMSVTRPPYMPDVVLIELAERFGTPLYVYNFDFVAQQVRHMRSPPALPPAPGCYRTSPLFCTALRLAHAPSCHAATCADPQLAPRFRARRHAALAPLRYESQRVPRAAQVPALDGCRGGLRVSCRGAWGAANAACALAPSEHPAHALPLPPPRALSHARTHTRADCTLARALTRTR